MFKTITLLLIGTAAGFGIAQEPAAKAEAKIEIAQIDTLVADQAKKGKPYFSFLEKSSLRMGIYHLRKGGKDTQKPHKRDEVYLVLDGSARIKGEKLSQKVKKGDLIFVPALAEHRFTNVTEDLDLLVFFSMGPSKPRPKKAAKHDDDG